MCTHHIFFIHASIDKHWYCFHVLAIVWCTWKSRYFFKILSSIPLAIYPEEGLLDYIVVLFLIFLEPLFHSNLYAEYIMRNAGLDEAQAGIKTAGEISVTSDMHMIPALWQKVKRNWRASWWKLKRRGKKTGLKLNI